VHDRAQWAQANPALAAGILAADALEADVASTAESVFRCYRLGQWVRGLACWLGEAGAEIWGACESPFRFVRGEPTWAGVDMALKKDSAAVVLGQRRPDGRLHAVARIWFPQNGLIDASEIMEYLRQAAADYKLVAAYYDPRYFDLPARMLADEGLAMVEFPQSLERMTPAVAGTFDAIRKGVLTHDGDPAFTEQVLNAAPRFNEAGFVLSKTKSAAKIDAAVAMCMMQRAVETPTPVRRWCSPTEGRTPSVPVAGADADDVGVAGSEAAQPPRAWPPAEAGRHPRRSGRVARRFGTAGRRPPWQARGRTRPRDRTARR
jgi:phage terminase large subunit-like protein